MTYSSRNFLISGGDGSADRTPRFSKRLSSAMMSLQTSTHSSQMKTVGPAISLRTSFWSLLQNEQRRISPSPAFFTIGLFVRSQSPVPAPGCDLRFLQLGTGDRQPETDQGPPVRPSSG